MTTDTLTQQVRQAAMDAGYADVGFAPATRLTEYIDMVDSRQDQYETFALVGQHLKAGADLLKAHPWAKSLIVGIQHYGNCIFPEHMTKRFGRYYLNDSRVSGSTCHGHDAAFRENVGAMGIRIESPFNVPVRIAGAYAGVVNYGKNCFAYANRVAEQSSWLYLDAFLIDAQLDYDTPTLETRCPDGCRACIDACPTGALYAPLKMNVNKCISWQCYRSRGITPRELRRAMDPWIYGCDICQDVCPRNRTGLTAEVDSPPRLKARSQDCSPEQLLAMTQEHYEAHIQPSFFYMGPEKLEYWHMNAARVMGTSGQQRYVPLLIEALHNNPSELVRGMAAWSLGELGGPDAHTALQQRQAQETGLVLEEIDLALEVLKTNQ